MGGLPRVELRGLGGRRGGRCMAEVGGDGWHAFGLCDSCVAGGGSDDLRRGGRGGGGFGAEA